MPINDRLKELLSVNQNKRLAEEKARENRRDNPKILRHTTYQGDRKIQQLGDEIIENGVVLNNQAVEINLAVLVFLQSLLVVEVGLETAGGMGNYQLKALPLLAVNSRPRNAFGVQILRRL